MFGGCGGLSAAVVDVARLAAVLACRTGNLLPKSDTIDAWKGSSAKWLDEIEDLVEGQDWGTTDLFPNYGMPKLGGVSGFAKAPKLRLGDGFAIANAEMARSAPPIPGPGPILRH